MSKDLLVIYLPNAVAGAVLRGGRVVRTAPILRSVMGLTRPQVELWARKRGYTYEMYRPQVELWARKRGYTYEMYRPLDTQPHLAYVDNCPATLLE